MPALAAPPGRATATRGSAGPASSKPLPEGLAVGGSHRPDAAHGPRVTIPAPNNRQQSHHLPGSVLARQGLPTRPWHGQAACWLAGPATLPCHAARPCAAARSLFCPAQLMPLPCAPPPRHDAGVCLPALSMGRRPPSGAAATSSKPPPPRSTPLPWPRGPRQSGGDGGGPWQRRHRVSWAVRWSQPARIAFDALHACQGPPTRSPRKQAMSHWIGIGTRAATHAPARSALSPVNPGETGPGPGPAPPLPLIPPPPPSAAASSPDGIRVGTGSPSPKSKSRGASPVAQLRRPD